MNDWGLLHYRNYEKGSVPTGIASELQSENQPFRVEDEQIQISGARQHHFLIQHPCVYYGAISLNFILRLTWSIKLSTHFHRAAEKEMGVFILELLEIVRRWIWVYFRVEWESLKHADSSRMDRTLDRSLEMITHEF